MTCHDVFVVDLIISYSEILLLIVNEFEVFRV